MSVGGSHVRIKYPKLELLRTIVVGMCGVLMQCDDKRWLSSEAESYLAGDWQVWHFWAVIGSTHEEIHKQGW